MFLFLYCIHFQFFQLFTSIFEGQTQIVSQKKNGASFQELISFAEFCNDQRIMGDLELSQKLKAPWWWWISMTRGILDKPLSFSDDQLRYWPVGLYIYIWYISKIFKNKPFASPKFLLVLPKPSKVFHHMLFENGYLLWWGYNMSTYFYRVFLRIIV